MSLDEKIHCMKHNYKTCKWIYPVEDVKQFIKELQKESHISLGQDIMIIRWSKFKEIIGKGLI